jgi:hypothetical protein
VLDCPRVRQSFNIGYNSKEKDQQESNNSGYLILLGYIYIWQLVAFFNKFVEIVTHSNYVIKFPSNICQVLYLWPIQ